MATARKPRSASTKRAAQADLDTRGRILQVAWDLIAARGNAALTLVDVAREAGVSRQTLYLLFGSRAGLLLAMVEHMDARAAAVPQLARARQAVSPREAFEPYVRVWLDYLPQVFPVARALAAAAALGDREAHAAWDSRMKLLRAGFAQVTSSLHEAGALRDGWTPRSAADWLFSQTHVDAWQHLVVEARWKPREAVERIVATLRETLLADG
jgi:AcrR family transcriptional regulator